MLIIYSDNPISNFTTIRSNMNHAMAFNRQNITGNSYLISKRLLRVFEYCIYTGHIIYRHVKHVKQSALKFNEKSQKFVKSTCTAMHYLSISTRGISIALSREETEILICCKRFSVT